MRGKKETAYIFFVLSIKNSVPNRTRFSKKSTKFIKRLETETKVEENLRNKQNGYCSNEKIKKEKKTKKEKEKRIEPVTSLHLPMLHFQCAIKRDYVNYFVFALV